MAASHSNERSGQQLEVMQPLKYLLNYTFLKKDILTAMQLKLCLLGPK